MAANIKGITIEINGNTTPLQKELSKVNKSLKDTQRQLKDVDKLLKLDPKNTTLLQQKQDLLRKSIEDTKSKLDTEREALKQLQAQDKTDEVTKQMNELERQIVSDEQALKSAQKQLKEFGAVGTQQAKVVGEQMQKAGKAMQDVGSNLTTHVTAPIVAAGGAAMAAFNEVDKGYDIVIKKTGAAGDAAQEMYDIVDNLATSIPTDFETAGEAVGEVNTRFGLTGDALEELSEQFIKFAKLNDTDVSTSIDEVQKALSAFGLSAEDAEGLLDQLNATGQATGVSVDTLTSGLIQNGTAFQELGLDINQSVALMGELEKSGANGETVMQGLRKALKSAAKDGKPLNEALTDLQDTIENGTDDMDGLTAAYELFGKSGDQIYGAVKNGSLDFRNLGESASDAAGSVSDTFETTLSPMDEWAMTLNELKLSGAALGATVGEMLVPAIQKAGDMVSSLRQAWEGLSPQQQEMIVQIAGIVAVIGPVVAIIGSIVAGIGSLITSMTAIAAVFGTTIGVVAGVAAGIAALIAIIVLLIMNWDKVKAKVKEVWEKVSEYVANLKENVKAKFDEMKQNVQDKIQQIKQDMQDKWNQIKQDAVDKVVGMKNDVVNKLVELKSSAVEKLNDIKAKFKEKFDDIKDKVKGVIEDIKGFFEGLKLKIPKPELPKLPHFSITTSTKTIMGKDITYPTGFDVDWYAKAMSTPYMFTQPTVMQTPYGMIGAGEAGNEIMYGHDNLMRDITAASAANNSVLATAVYNAVVAGMEDVRIQIGNREFGRILREAGAI